MPALTPQDATRYWLSRRTGNDLFLLYCFEETDRPTADLRALVARRSAEIADLRLRVRERRFAYPEWTPCDFVADQVVEHEGAGTDWANTVAALGDLVARPLRAEEYAWRLHLFRGVRGAPAGDGPALIAVLQLSHALADGQRAAAIARALFSQSPDGCDRAVPAFLPDGSPAAPTSAAPSDSSAMPGSVLPPGSVAVVTSASPDDPPAVTGSGSPNDSSAAPASVSFEGSSKPSGSVSPDGSSAAPGYVSTEGFPKPSGSIAPRDRPTPGGPGRVRRPKPSLALAGWAVTGALKDLAPELLSLAAAPILLGRTATSGLAAERARRELAARTARGELPPIAPELAPTPLNRGPRPRAHAVRMLVRSDLRVPGHTVTVVVLTALGAALPRYLEARGEPSERIAAQVSMAHRQPRGRIRNNYRDLAVELHVGESDPRRRAERIAATLAERRRRAEHPLLAAQDRVTATIPAPILRRDVATYPLDHAPAALSAHTVVSSVNRGPADLSLAGGRVRFTAGFPALGAVMHLTHGVHGLGDTVTVSVHADPAVLPDVEHYAALLDAALTRTAAALRE
ncbi:WS/DGAT domain-containing protein [Nocardia sp. CDC159]|uniref:WS/DGAT domain-containing protein n=1 Tax=Nocardia pulmonis TaxID=2951408 RepID=A0A9X2EIA2_9NOCA|nr:MULTISPECIES: WS/DGAT domain-containing protein [Nocardia]MCM6778546.1 WS/DGAT domain-containing protein [Nocardia pulmonis]MCM6791435.1 WS/DGAT domain-containing protein [Nocardia sp. CDC159]